MWWFGSSKAGVNIWMCRCLYWVRLRWSWFRTAHLVLCPRFVTKTALTEETPQCFSFCWAALPSLQDYCFPWAPTLQQHGWSGGCVGICLGQLIHRDQRDSKPYHIVQGNKGRAAGWGGGGFTIQQMLRSWVGIGLLVPADGCCIICLFFSASVITLSLYLNHQVFLAFVLLVGHMIPLGGNEQVAVWGLTWEPGSVLSTVPWTSECFLNSFPCEF